MQEKLDSDQIYKTLKKRIIKLEYDPGEVLNEIDIADEFNVSRTPIRKVFQLLMQDKLLNIIPRVGAQVSAIDFMEMKSIFEITRELDPFAASLTVERIDKESIQELEEIIDRLKEYDISINYQEAINDDERFHEIIFESCGNPWLKDILKSLHYHTERLWHYCEKYFDKINLFSETLENVLDAIKENDKEKAKKYTKEHIDAFVDKIKKELL
ncbi:GntR family transcriptional regulator [Senegalia sp. (in: firmicutes)]|uniref:GntR family transcriptional regulator n=1 Tax=Senegalia sp. (in: firmicutes) TaxID=1924098 RepID=UPI003F9E63EB